VLDCSGLACTCQTVESRHVVPDAPLQSLMKSYLEAATGSGRILQHKQSAYRTGGGTIGGSMIRRGQTTTFPERLEITELAAA
jgi:hypothetical protein